MIIGVCGFSWSGSSAVIDYLAEFQENQIYNEREFLLAFFPDGLQDLDYQLNINCAKFLSSCLAIPRFKKAAGFLLRDATHGAVTQLADEYIHNICQAHWLGTGQGQILRHNMFLYKSVGRHLLNHIPKKICMKMKMYPIGDMFFSIKPDHFIMHTQNFTDAVLRSIGLDPDRNIVLDQPFAGNAPQRGMRYYRDSRAIVVDRDPRDMFMLAKKIYPNRFYGTPVDNIHDYVEFYYHMHKGLKEELKNKDILYVKFEDLIYEYEKTGRKISSFLGLGEHSRPPCRFDPDESINNTRLFEHDDTYKREIAYIERHLKQYLYDFGKYPDKLPNGKVFDEKPVIKVKKNGQK